MHNTVISSARQKAWFSALHNTVVFCQREGVAFSLDNYTVKSSARESFFQIVLISAFTVVDIKIFICLM